MRGGNRNVALIALEGVALVFLAAMVAHATPKAARPSLHALLFWFLLLSPAWLALVYLLPVPPSWWEDIPGRELYAELLTAAGIARHDWLPVSLVPDATTVSLLAGIPLMAAFGAGYWANLRQLQIVIGTFVMLGFAEVVIGMLQLAGGANSSLYFGGNPGRPFGTFANANHFGNYIAMVLAAYVWLGWSKLTEARQRRAAHWEPRSSQARAVALWTAGAVLLLVGILMSRSRGAGLGGLPAAMGALVLALTTGAGPRPLRPTLLIVGGALAAGVALVGFDTVVSRFDLERMAGDAPFRIVQATTTLEGAAHFWPFGAGWGTYAEVYPRFQPATLIGTADYAHHDYAQMLFEGGIFAVLLMAAFGWLFVARAITLVRLVLRQRRLRREEMAAAVCGFGLLGFLLHSLVEFNMHIPANAIAAALLAGIYLRRLPEPQRREGPSDD